MRRVRFKLTVLFLAALLVLTAPVLAYVPTMRDTEMPEPMVEYELTALPAGEDGFTLLEETGGLQVYYRDDRDVFAVVDSRNGYTWKTGLDVPFNQDIDRAVNNADTPEEKLAAAVPKEENLNATFIGLANSVLSAEYYDDAHNISRTSSAARSGAESTLSKVSGENGRYVLDVNFSEIDLRVKVHITVTADGLRYQIFDEELSGGGLEYLAALILTPFLGASGGEQSVYDPETDMYGPPQRKPVIPGYVMVPDGPGALMRFQDNAVSFNQYVGKVYGPNLADTPFHVSEELETIPAKDPLAPVFGIAHGDRQAAFVFWADDGAEYLELTVSPEENRTSYTYAYPRFVYNQSIYQIYNRAGAGYQRLYPERNHFNIDVTYSFLANDGREDGFPADYTGMAFKYREHLLEQGILTERASSGSLPLHLDFVMSDVKEDIFGTKEVVVTNSGDVGDILSDLYAAGVKNINAGLLGAQKGGITAGKPWRLDFLNEIGSRSAFSDLISEMKELGSDVYFTQDYSAINELQMNISSNMAYHRTNWGVERWIRYTNTSVPISMISFAKPRKSADWMISQTTAMKRVGATSVGIQGVSGRIVSHYGSDPIGAPEAIGLLSGTVANLGMSVSAYTPNMYFWNSTDRFINAPVIPTQYIIETDTVPFLQLLLNGTMEMYAPYANFSFYTREDILRMIDYNVFPSFVLTRQPAYLLASTNSAGFYSTSYELYRDIIIGICAEMGAVYAGIAGQRWIGRDIMENGVVVNRYDGGANVMVNYTEKTVAYEGQTAAPQSAVVWEG
jgi:hypothetical protein